jgi:protease I
MIKLQEAKPTLMQLKGKRIAVLAAEMYEDLELWYPYLRMKEEGALLVIVGPGFGPNEVSGKNGYPVVIDTRAKKAKNEEFDAVIIPGGYAPDILRRCSSTLEFVKEMNDKGKVVAAICHAGWVLISAGIVKGRTVTSFYSIKDDMTNAGGLWVDLEVAVDGNLITSRSVSDLPAFCREIIKALK